LRSSIAGKYFFVADTGYPEETQGVEVFLHNKNKHGTLMAIYQHYAILVTIIRKFINIFFLPQCLWGDERVSTQVGWRNGIAWLFLQTIKFSGSLNPKLLKPWAPGTDRAKLVFFDAKHDDTPIGTMGHHGNTDKPLGSKGAEQLVVG
jgi:hypothetical protein